MQPFDVVLKVLVRSSMAQITGTRVVHWLPTELPQVQNLRVDLLGETADGELIQIEIQSTNDHGLAFRMLRYLGFIVEIHKRMPKQILLYVGREPLAMEGEFRWPDGFIRYAVIDMREVDGNVLLGSPEPSDNVLAILSRLQDNVAAIRSILEKVSRMPREEAREYYQALLILSGLRGLAKTVKEEARTMLQIDLSENEVLGPAYLRGREEGHQEGLQEGLQEGQVLLLRQLIQEKFGAVPAWLETRLLESSPADLRGLALRLLQSHTLEGLLG